MACRLPMVIVPVLSSSSVLTSPAASTARPDMASTLRCTSRSMPAMPIADSSAPIVVGISATSSATRIDQALRRLGVERHRLQRDHGQHEDDGQRREQDVQRDLVRRLLPLRALDQRDHPVDEGLARLGGDLHHDPVGQHPGAAGDRRPVAAGLPDDRGGLAGDRRLVHRGDALDHVAVAGDDLAGLDHHVVAERELGAGDLLLAECRSGRAASRSAAGPRCPAWSGAASRPAPCRGPRPRPRPGWRRPRSATARPRSSS